MSEMTEEREMNVKCMDCGREYVCTPFNDFYPDNKNDPTKGRCERCMFAYALAPKPIAEPHLTEVCKLRRGAETCCFLSYSESFNCLKGSSMEPLIREKMSKGSMTSKGDNCSGPPNFVPTAK